MNRAELEDIKARQQKIRAQLKAHQVLVLFSNPKNKSHALPFNGRFLAEPNFFYTTGINHPDLVAVMTTQILFVFAPIYAKQRYVWDSGLVGVKELVKLKDFHQIDEVYAKTDFDEVFLKLIQSQPLSDLIVNIHESEFGLPQELKKTLIFWQSQKSRDEQSRLKQYSDAHVFFESIRVHKTLGEIEIMSQCAQIAAQTHNHIAKKLPTMHNEQRVCAEFAYQASLLGADGLAYPSIVASGENGCVLHYQENNQPIAESDCILIDAGTLLKGYCSDITRVFPKSGQFTGAMRDLYQVVYEIQSQIIQSLPQIKTHQGIEDLAIQLIAKGLIDLKLLNCSLDEALEKKHYRDFYMHRVGHHLGLDVHDLGLYRDENGKSIPISPNMVFTIEPGIYIDPKLKVPNHFKGLAVRIEDDIALLPNANQKGGCDFEVQVLSASAKKSIADLESLMNP